ncbi:MAG: hypothetical protein VXV96_06430 [Bdellovibrionota bacterium]|nr:hypothetical protein [Bdellovibrionota bacterium]
MNYLQQYCQRANHIILTFGLVALALSSCSSNPQPEAKKEEAIGVKAKPVWFNAPERFRLRTSMGDIPGHPFFDLTAFRTKESSDISYYLTTPVGSAHKYDLDLVSGELFRERTYCSQDDIWESYSSKIDRPNFSQGIIPRLLDQTGEPQRVWVFGAKEHLLSNRVNSTVQSQRARIVGGVLLQFCDEYPCRSQKAWLSQLVLIGVNPFDPQFEKVMTISDLKSKVDWAYMKAFAENGFGRTKLGPKPVPAYRLVGEISGQKALDNAYKYGHHFAFEEINSLRKNCFYLYDYLWRSQKKVRAAMNKAYLKEKNLEAEYSKRAKELRDMAKFQMSRFFKEDFEEEVKEDEQSAAAKERILDWSRFFFHFYEKYGERFRTCARFVRPANQKINPERMWFFAHMTNWFNLEDLNYYYLCRRRTWVENTLMANGKRRYQTGVPRECSSKQLDESFDQAVTVMSALNNSGKEHYHFLEFDNGIGGTHQELFSWTHRNGKHLGCNARELEEKEPIFPQDISWDKFTKKLRRGRYDIIR